jgi:hypothetical protein
MHLAVEEAVMSILNFLGLSRMKHVLPGSQAKRSLISRRFDVEALRMAAPLLLLLKTT